MIDATSKKRFGRYVYPAAASFRQADYTIKSGDVIPRRQMAIAAAGAKQVEFSMSASWRISGGMVAKYEQVQHRACSLVF